MMTREEAIVLFEKQLTAAQVVLDSGFGSNPGENDSLYRRRKEMAEIALSALRPITREQVEKVWRGCNNCRTCDSCAYRYIKAEEEPCWSCNTNIYSNYKPEPNRKFCPACGAPMTDEAVEMVMEKLEALYDKDV